MSVTFYPNYIHNVGFNAAVEPSVVGQNGNHSDGETFSAGDGGMFDLVDSSRDNLLTIDTNGEAGDFDFDFDLTSNIADADFVIMDKVNLGSAQADTTIIHGVSGIPSQAGWTGVLGNQMLATNVASFWHISEEISVTDDIILYLFDATTDDDWTVKFRDFEAGNFSADVTAGEITIGKKFATDYTPKIGLIESSDFGTGILRSKGGHKYGFKNYGAARRWALKWKYFTAAEKTTLEAVWAVTEGKRYPFYIDLGENTNPTLYYVRFAMDRPVFTCIGKDAYAVTIVIEEEI